MAVADDIAAAAKKIAEAENWNQRVTLIRKIPEEFGKAHHADAYATISKAVYVSELAPDFAYIHWRDEYELEAVQAAYDSAFRHTDGFTKVNESDLVKALEAAPNSLLTFRLFLGFTTQEFAAATAIVLSDPDAKPLSNSTIKSMEAGTSKAGASTAAAVISRAMEGILFPPAVPEVRSKLAKPDTIDGWKTVRKYANEHVPFAVFLHQRHYGGSFRQLLDATSSKRGDVLESAVEEIFDGHGIMFVKTGSTNQSAIAEKFGLTVKPAPDFVVYDKTGNLRAMLECKQANDGGTARDKAARFATLRAEGMRLGGVPVFAILAGLGWRRTQDTLGPVVRDTDGRVFTLKTLSAMMTVEPFPMLKDEH